VSAADLRESIQADPLDAERSYGRGVGERETKCGVVCAAHLGEATEERAREGVAGAGRIDLDLERVGGDEVDAIPCEEEGAVLSLFDDEALRAHAEHELRGAPEVVGAREQSKFLVVDDEAVDALEQAVEGRALTLDPEVHGVGGDE